MPLDGMDYLLVDLLAGTFWCSRLPLNIAWKSGPTTNFSEEEQSFVHGIRNRISDVENKGSVCKYWRRIRKKLWRNLTPKIPKQSNGTWIRFNVSGSGWDSIIRTCTTCIVVNQNKNWKEKSRKGGYPEVKSWTIIICLLHENSLLHLPLFIGRQLTLHLQVETRRSETPEDDPFSSLAREEQH